MVANLDFYRSRIPQVSSPPYPPLSNIGCDEHLCALHAGNYRLRPKVFDEIKWLFLSYLQSYFSTKIILEKLVLISESV
jgi:hypothetical protein